MACKGLSCLQVFNDRIENTTALLNLRIRYVFSILRDALAMSDDVLKIKALTETACNLIVMVADQVLASTPTREGRTIGNYLATYDSILPPKTWVESWNSIFLQHGYIQ